MLMPTSSPLVLMSAPPELPTLMGASVWMKFSKVATPSWPRPCGAHDALRDGLRETDRIADGEHDVTDAQPVRVAERHHGEVALEVELQDGEIGFRIPSDDLRLGDPTVGELGADQVGRCDHVVIRDDVSGGVDDHARAQALFEPLAEAGPGVAKQLLDGARLDAFRHEARRVDVDHRRRGALDRLGI